MEDLCIIEGKYCWWMHIDLIVLKCDGYPLDACSIAAYLALQSTAIPKTLLKLGDDGNPEAFEIKGDVFDSAHLNTERVPLCLCIGKIDQQLICDLTLCELLAIDCLYITAFDSKGNICGSIKAKGGTLTPAEAINVINTGYRLHCKLKTLLV